MSVVTDDKTGLPLISPDAVLLDRPHRKPTRQLQRQLALDAARETVNTRLPHLGRRARRKMAGQLAKAARKAAKEAARG